MASSAGYLLDTNVISELRRNKPHGAVIAWLRTIPADALFLSAFTIAELQSGVERVREQDSEKAASIENWIERVCQTWSVLPLDSTCCREWARTIHGQSDSVFEDAFIAATASIHRLTVITRNTKEFDKLGIAAFNPFQFRD